MSRPSHHPARRRRRALRVSVAAAGALVLASGAAAVALPSGPDGPSDGEVLRVALGSDQGCLDPQQVSSNDSIYVARQIADSLTDQDPETGQIVPWLAERWEVSDDARAYTFTLRDGVTFSDGTPVDSEAVAANLDSLAEGLGPRASLATGYLAGYAETDVHDARTFTVRFHRPTVQFLQATSTVSLAVVSPASIAAGAEQRCAGVVGSGPFVVDAYSPGAGSTLSRRDDYGWGSSLWQETGRAGVDRVEFSIVPESGVRAGLLQSDQVDLIGSIAPQDEDPLAASGARLLQRANPGTPFGLLLNHEHEPFTDPLVRQAVSAALDRQEIVDVAFFRDSQPATSMVSRTTPGYADLSGRLQHDPQRAAAALQEAGYARDPDGYWTKDGAPLTFTVTWSAVSPHNAPALEMLQQQLDDAGIRVRLREISTDQAGQILAESDFDAFWTNTTRADVDILRTSYHTGLANRSNAAASPTDGLLEQIDATTDSAARDRLAARAQDELLTSLPVIPVAELDTQLATRPEVSGVLFDSGSRLILHDARVDAEQKEH